MGARVILGSPGFEKYPNARCSQVSGTTITENYAGNEVFRLIRLPGKISIFFQKYILRRLSKLFRLSKIQNALVWGEPLLAPMDKNLRQINAFGVTEISGKFQNMRCSRVSSTTTLQKYVGNEIFRLISLPRKMLVFFQKTFFRRCSQLFLLPQIRDFELKKTQNTPKKFRLRRAESQKGQ